MSPSIPELGENETAHDEVEPEPLRAQEKGTKLPAPLGVVEKLTVPVGTLLLLPLSVTDAVQVVVFPSTRDVGEQLIEVDVGWDRGGLTDPNLASYGPVPAVQIMPKVALGPLSTFRTAS